MITIRHESAEDTAGVREINLRAFGGRAEADLVDQLRDSCPDAISLVAEDDGQLVGHILFSPVVIEYVDLRITGMSLGPMSVLPELQRGGIGSKLVESGLDAVSATGCPFVVVLGHPEYYPRFGFVLASEHRLACEFNVPDEMFMILPINKQVLQNASGVAKYQSEFDVWK